MHGCRWKNPSAIWVVECRKLVRIIMLSYRNLALILLANSVQAEFFFFDAREGSKTDESDFLIYLHLATSQFFKCFSDFWSDLCKKHSCTTAQAFYISKISFSSTYPSNVQTPEVQPFTGCLLVPPTDHLVKVAVASDLNMLCGCQTLQLLSSFFWQECLPFLLFWAYLCVLISCSSSRCHPYRNPVQKVFSTVEIAYFRDK